MCVPHEFTHIAMLGSKQPVDCAAKVSLFAAKVSPVAAKVSQNAGFEITFSMGCPKNVLESEERKDQTCG